jgi:hypothetical protein
MLVRSLDPSNADDRHLAATTVMDVLGGAFEATLPASRCSVPVHAGEILARSCDGWTVSATFGEGPGALDVIDVRGPKATAPTPPPAPKK